MNAINLSAPTTKTGSANGTRFLRLAPHDAPVPVSNAQPYAAADAFIAFAPANHMKELSPRANTTIRLSTPLDAEAIFSVHRDSVASLCSTFYSPQQISMWLEGRSPATYLDAISRGEISVAVSAGHIVGFVEAVSGEIVKLFVHGSKAGTGIGNSLMDVGLTMARRGHKGPIRIESTKNAESFYAKYGFRRVGSGVFSRGGSSVAIEVVHLSGPGA